MRKTIELIQERSKKNDNADWCFGI
jgi:hypothetical protein